MDHRLVKRLEALIGAFEARQAQDLKRLGGGIIEQAVLKNDESLAKVSVIAYALYKILSKDHFVQSGQWPKISQSISQSLLKSVQALEKNDNAGFAKSLDSAIERIQFIDSELSNFAKDIYGKAKIKQASTAYAMGLSLSQAGSLTGADRKELQRYIGSTRIHDEQPAGLGIEQRLRNLKEVLRG